jgi:hypothetical protein
MEKARSLFRWAGTLVVVAGVLVFGMAVQGEEKPAPVSGEMRTDMITIDVLKLFGKLDRPAVIFMHEAHTEALKKKEKDCKTCHLVEKNRPALAEQDALSVRFKRIKDTSREEVMEIYHADCIACHREMADAGEKSGPIEICGGCHREDAPVVSSWQPIVMDRSLHYRHVEATKDGQGKERCELCHHEYDEIAKKVYYVKDKEGSCRYCHTEEPATDKMTMREASHLSCVNCHRKTLAEKKDPDQKVGAITCSGCHDLGNQEKIKKLKEVPRLKRKQPDVALLQAKKERCRDREERRKRYYHGPCRF